MKAIKIGILAVLSALIMTLPSASVAQAITGNYQLDNTRPFVGLVIFYTVDQQGNRVPVEACTGILLSPHVVLTAGHGAATGLAVTVSFDEGPIMYNPENGQYSGISKLYDGVAYPNPDYAWNVEGKGGMPSTARRDVGIVILNEAVSGVSKYAQLPTEGLVDTLPTKTAVTLTGYGLQVHLSPRNGGVADTWTGLLARNSAQAKLLSNNFAWSDEFIRVSANPGQGKGGIAYGDSGGPVFLGQTNLVLAVTSYVTNPNCVGETYHSRIDIPSVLNWIKSEVITYG